MFVPWHLHASTFVSYLRKAPVPASQMGGSKAIINALVRGLKKHGGRLMLRSHVNDILIEGGRATGVRLRPPSDAKAAARGTEVIRALCGVVSNASVWDTQRLLPPGAAPVEWVHKSEATPVVSTAPRL